MNLPVQTAFRNMDHSDAVVERLQAEANKLEKYFDRITSCRVVVEAPHRHHRRGDAFHVRIELGVPGKELVVGHEPTLRSVLKQEDEAQWKKGLELGAPHKDVYVAIRDAFAAMRRQVQDYASQRNDVKPDPRGQPAGA